MVSYVLKITLSLMINSNQFVLTTVPNKMFKLIHINISIYKIK